MTSSSTKKVTMPLPTGSLIKYFHRKFTSKVEWKMGYKDLAYFMLLEEDNSCKPSLEVLKEDYFTLRDLQGCKLSGNFFKIFCNLNKFMVFESRDPFLIRQEREDPSLTQWDSFAHRVYMAFDGRRW